MEIKIAKEELQKRKLFLGLPCYGGMCAAIFSRSIADLSALCVQYGIELKMYYLMNESLIQRARNYISDEFMRSGSTHLMFIDSDIGFNAQDVIAMLAMSSDESEYDVLCGPYPKKCISWEKIKVAVDKGVADKNPNTLENYVGDYVFNPVGGAQTIPLNEPAEVLEAGTGFMMIKRRVFERFVDYFSEMAYKPDHVRTEHFDGSRDIWAFFHCIIDKGYTSADERELLDRAAKGENVTELARNMLELKQKASKRYLSEDYYFSQMSKKTGSRIFLCPWMRLQHVGSYIFGGSLADIAQLGVTATADPSLLKKK